MKNVLCKHIIVVLVALTILGPVLSATINVYKLDRYLIVPWAILQTLAVIVFTRNCRKSERDEFYTIYFILGIAACCMFVYKSITDGFFLLLYSLIVWVPVLDMIKRAWQMRRARVGQGGPANPDDQAGDN